MVVMAVGAKLYNTSTLPASRLARKTERWFARNQRTLPWRDGYDPYRVWVAEIMAQQTRMEVVLDYFGRFLERFPTLEKAAEVVEHDFHPRLLRHDLGDPDAVRIVAVAPGEGTLVPGEPPLGFAGETRRWQRACIV